jgi:hypothetical protein
MKMWILWQTNCNSMMLGWFSMVCWTMVFFGQVYAEDGLSRDFAEKRLFLSPEKIAQLDRQADKGKQPLILPDIEFAEGGSDWLYYRGVLKKEGKISVLINQQWISQPTKVQGVLISPHKISPLDALPLVIRGKSLWLVPGQGVKLSVDSL